MTKNLFLIPACLMLLCVSCNPSDNNEVPHRNDAAVTVCFEGFTATVSDFSKSRTRALDDPSDYEYVGALDLAFYDAEGAEVYKATQLKKDSSTYVCFGEFSFRLPEGNYTMVAIGRDVGTDDVFVLSSPTQAAYTSERARETFTAVQPVSITGTASVSFNVSLSRVATKLVVNSTDGRPDGAAKIRTTYSAGSKSFNPTTGLASDNNGFGMTNTPKADIGSCINIKSFAFLTADEQTMNVTLEVLDADGGVMMRRMVPDVPFKRNRVTRLKGRLFSYSGALKLDTAWVSPITVDF